MSFYSRGLRQRGMTVPYWQFSSWKNWYLKHKESPIEDGEESHGVLQGDHRKRKAKLRETAKKTGNQT